MKTYKQLQQERADLVAKGRALFAKADAEKRELAAEEKAQDDEINAQLVAVNADLARHEARLERERSVEAVADGNVKAAQKARFSGFHENAEDDPKRGFADMGDFALAVKAAYTPGGRVDERLNVGAAPTNFHKENGSDEGRMVPPAFKQGILEAITEGDDSLIGDVDAEPTGANQVEILRDESTPWGATGVQAAWRSEGVAMSASKLATAGENVKLHELYAFVLATGELLQDAPRLADRLTRKAGLAIRYKQNEAIVNGTGAGQPLGWFTHTAKASVAKEAAQAAATVVAANVAKMYARCIDPGKGIWYVNQDVLPQLFTMTLGDKPIWFPPTATIQNAPAGGFLFGRPVKLLENCQTVGTQGDIQYVNPKGYYAATKAGIEFAESMHLFFDYNINAFRWITRLGGQPYLSAVISPAKGSTTRAHVVVLDTRA